MDGDDQIWEEFKKGDKNALSKIYFQHVNLLYMYGKKYSTDNELIKDTIQDLFFDLIRTRSNLGKTDNIRLYLIKAFKHRIVRNLQKLSNQPKLVNKSELKAEIVYSAEDTIISKEELSHRKQLIHWALREISPRQREILFYRFTCDFEYSQICEIMSIKYDSARKQVFRALKTLKDKLPYEGIFSILIFSSGYFF